MSASPVLTQTPLSGLVLDDPDDVAPGDLVAEGPLPPGGPDLALITLLVLMLLASAGLGPVGCGTSMAEPTTPGRFVNTDSEPEALYENAEFLPVVRSSPDPTDAPRPMGLSEICQLSTDSVFFEPESAVISDAAEQTLGSIAWCMTAGALRERDVLVIGFTDPSPDAAYSKALSRTRASAVKRTLRDLGVDETRLTVVSAGDTGTEWLDRQSWGNARRVMIALP